MFLKHTFIQIFMEELNNLSKNYVRKKCFHGKRKHRCVICTNEKKNTLDLPKKKYVSKRCIHENRKDRCKHCNEIVKKYSNKKKIKSEKKPLKVNLIDKKKKIPRLCLHDTSKKKSICIHKKQKSICIDCRGSGICFHNCVKRFCKDCCGTGLCIHGIDRRKCKNCGGSAFCEHSIRKTRCKTCGGSCLCRQEFCEKVSKSKKYRGYCFTCFISLFPEEPVSRNYKTKEGAVLCFIKNSFPDLPVVSDRRVDGGCSKRRPDVLIDLLTHVIIVEVDENGHMTYDQSCEDRRMMQLSEDIAHRPLVFIRFNPDSNSSGPSCWGVDGRGLAVVKKKQASEWIERLAALSSSISFWSTTIPDKTITLIKLFY